MDRHPSPHVAPRIAVHEVAPHDGRQTQARFVPTAAAVA